MNKEYDDLEDEMEEEEEELEEEEEQEKAKKPVLKKKKSKVVEEEPKPTERYVAFFQEARVGIMDTITKEVIVEGFQDVPTATIEAIKLNKLDRIEIASGA